MRTELRGFPVPERLRLPPEHIAPIIDTHGERVSPRFRDTPFYSARVTDGGNRDADDHHACELANLTIAALRETPFRRRHFDIVEILPGVESAGASNDGDIAPPPARAHAARNRDACASCAQSFFPRRPRKKTTVATCGTTVVVRDSTVTLWA
ncbi:darcynin family protein [Burkholderia sp. LMG 32019]|uniref:darcynin family protein n=1 Tax=Burkholderia sp. LMG 32019 TaxID=3158173 RepID=UPI003C2BCBF3